MTMQIVKRSSSKRIREHRRSSCRISIAVVLWPLILTVLFLLMTQQVSFISWSTYGSSSPVSMGPGAEVGLRYFPRDVVKRFTLHINSAQWEQSSTVENWMVASNDGSIVHSSGIKEAAELWVSDTANERDYLLDIDSKPAQEVSIIPKRRSWSALDAEVALALHNVSNASDSPEREYLHLPSSEERRGNSQYEERSHDELEATASEVAIGINDQGNADGPGAISRRSGNDALRAVKELNSEDGIRGIEISGAVSVEDPTVEEEAIEGSLDVGILKMNTSSDRTSSGTPCDSVPLQQRRECMDNTKCSKKCATAEEMGSAAAGDTRSSTLKLRSIIRSYFAEHGAERVRGLPAHEFCARNFVLGKAQEDGFGNNMYKLLTAAGLGIIFNRSLIIGYGKHLPFGDYLEYSSQAFSMVEYKQLWVVNDCAGKYHRPLVMQMDPFENPAASRSLCEEWTQSTHPVIWFRGTTDTVALQFLLKSQHDNVRSAATLLLGDPSIPNSRPNAFGELMRAIIQPKANILDAINWVLKRGSEPEIALHLRMLHSVNKRAAYAASHCITRILSTMPTAKMRPRVVVISDTPSVIFAVKRSLGGSADVINFDYRAYLKSSSNVSNVMRADYFQPPRKRMRDWGPLPRWVAIVDFFLASRAQYAVVSGAKQRVGTTYAQLVASLAAANSLENIHPTRLFSSFQSSLLIRGLASQSGWGHSWRPFGGHLSCPNQPDQCAETPLLPYAWWDGPWQSPVLRDIGKFRRWGIPVGRAGELSTSSLRQFCRKKETVGKRLPLFDWSS